MAADSTILETPRLRLRRLAEDDAPFMLALLNDEAFLRFIGDRNVRTDEEARAYILERSRRPVEQLEHGQLAVRRELLQRQRKVEGVAADRGQLALQARALEKRREHLGRDLGQRLAGYGARVEARQLAGHVQAAVRGEAAHHRIDETCFLTAAGAEVAHRKANCDCPTACCKAAADPRRCRPP